MIKKCTFTVVRDDGIVVKSIQTCRTLGQACELCESLQASAIRRGADDLYYFIRF